MEGQTYYLEQMKLRFNCSAWLHEFKKCKDLTHVSVITFIRDNFANILKPRIDRD